MSRITHHTYDPSRMTDAQIDGLTQALYPAHCQVFDGVSLEAFRAYVVEPDALRTRIEVYRDERGQALGYTAVHVYERTLYGRPVLVVRMETGVHPCLRASGVSMPFSIDQLIRCRLDYPEAEIYYLGCLVSPASFLLFHKCAPISWPHPELDTPAETEALMCQLADTFGLAQADADRPLVRDIGWRLCETDEDIDRFQRSRRRPVQFYLEQNPDYTSGKGLLFLVPMGWDAFKELASAGRPTLLGTHLRQVATEQGQLDRIAL